MGKKNDADAIPMPKKMELNDVSDYYSFYVSIMEVSEDVFWNCDIGFVLAAANNKSAFDKWKNNKIRMLQQEKEKRSRRR